MEQFVFFTLKLIVVGTTENVSQFIMPLMSMKLHHSPDASTLPRFKLACYIFQKELNALALNGYVYSHLVLCVDMILLHLHQKINSLIVEAQN